MKICSVPTCERRAGTRSHCAAHATRLYKTGDLRADVPIHVKQILPCSVSDCKKTAITRTYCKTHYGRWQRTGDPQAHIPLKVPGKKSCKIESCIKIATSLGWCKGHYARYKKLGDPQASQPLRTAILKCKVEGCKKPHAALGYCQGHLNRFHKYGDPMPEKPLSRVRGVRINDQGYLTEYDYKTKKRRPQHRMIMEQTLGRPLRQGENVHHINGIRADNRPENLELWISSQPSGQRVDDLLKWAHEIIELYGSTSVSP